MTLDDFEQALWGIGVTAVATLMALVRGGDVKRIDAIEVRQDRMDDAASAGRLQLSNDIAELRKDVDRKHEHLVALITSRRDP